MRFSFVPACLLCAAVLSWTYAGAQCTDYLLTAGGGTFDSEISWNLIDDTGTVIATGPAVSGQALCLPDGCYTLELLDSFGDGWDGASWILTEALSGTIIINETLLVGASISIDFGLNDPACAAPPCADPYYLTVGGGLFDGEISWNLVDGSGIVVLSGTVFNNEPICLEDGCYTLQLTDLFGDGWDGAYWTLTDGDGTLLVSETLIAGAYGEVEFGVNDETCNLPPCPDAYTFTAGGGTFDSEISWSLLDGSGTVVYAGLATTGEFFCLGTDCYTLQLFDSFGDGWDGATWTLTDASGVQIGTGTLIAGAFDYGQISINGAECSDPFPDVLDVETGLVSAEALITDVFLGDCLEATNITYTGSLDALGTFSNGGSIGIEEGIIISTGLALSAEGPNTAGGVSNSFYTAGEPLLEALAGSTTNDAAIFEFDFVASTTEVTFTYVFASEEYDEFVCSSYNDAFGFFVSGPGYAPNTNIAAIPGTTDLVAINNINNNAGCGDPAYAVYYVNNDGGSSIEYDAYTVPLEALITTIPCETYQIKIAIADAGDSILDSAVLLQAESFNAGVDLDIAGASPVGGQSSPDNCEDTGSFVFVLNGDPLGEDVDITFTIGGTATADLDYDALPDVITFPAGSSIYELDVQGYLDQLDTTPESVTLTLDNVCSCSEPESITLYLCSPIMLGEAQLDLQAALEADETRTRLTWQAASTAHPDHFVMEKSLDGEYWTTLFAEAALVDVEGTHSYQGWDPDPAPGLNYYRARMVDVNGQNQVSPIRHVERRLVADPFVYPNPSSGWFHVEYAQELEVRAFDQRGREVALDQNGAGGYQLSSAASGCYTLRLTDRQGVRWHLPIWVR